MSGGYIHFKSNPVKNITSPIFPQAKRFSMKSLFSNNAQVLYKSHSLSIGGSGTVVNSRTKAKRT
jgi:hypothetical protein